LPRKPTRQPTDAELMILQVLWEIGPSTVREIHKHITRSQKTGYTTVLKTLQIMTDKGLVRRDASRRAHVYAAFRSEESTQGHFLGELVDRVYRGSAGKMVLQALSSKRATPEEIAEIRRMLDQLSRDDQNDND
jgi:BlaI family transcriptional regulator, penicillinase repressor